MFLILLYVIILKKFLMTICCSLIYVHVLGLAIQFKRVLFLAQTFNNFNNNTLLAFHMYYFFQTLLKSLYDIVDKEHAANYSLLMLWASLANAIPVS